MPRVFVVGAHLPRGGALMAYHVGRIAGRVLGLDPVALRVREETAAASAFDYPDELATMDVDDLLDVAEPDDVLVCNPLFSGRLWGLRFPGRTLMYVQGVNTYTVIDGFADHHVACSHFVRDHLALHYGWDVSVIVPFVDTARIGPPRPLLDRPPGTVAVVTKSLGDELLGEVRSRLQARHADVEVTFTHLRSMRHDEVLATLQGHRYLLTLTALEGHPLVPLEAMLSGCCVVGFHGGGGLEYMRPGVNAAVVGYPRLDAVVDALADVVRCPDRAVALAARARQDVGQQTYEAFDASWTAFLQTHLVP